jgi:hypothetical protein
VEQVRKVLFMIVVIAIILSIQVGDPGFASALTCPSGTKLLGGKCIGNASGTTKNPGGEWELPINRVVIGNDMYQSNNFTLSAINTYDLNTFSFIFNNSTNNLFTNQGLLMGSGNIMGNLTNPGLLALGLDTIKIDGNFDNTNGIMDVIIGSGDAHGMLDVTGQVKLGGAVNIYLDEGFLPQAGMKVAIIDKPSGLEGSIADMSVTQGWELFIDNDTEVWARYNTVPEPSTILLIGSGLLGLVGVGIRQRKKTASK